MRAGVLPLDRTLGGQPARPHENKAVVELATVCSLCNESSVEYANGTFSKIGEPTETAMIVLVEKLNVLNTPSLNSLSPEQRALACNRALREKNKKELTLEFTRDRKSMSTYVSTPSGNKLMVKVRPDARNGRGKAAPRHTPIDAH